MEDKKNTENLAAEQLRAVGLELSLAKVYIESGTKSELELSLALLNRVVEVVGGVNATDELPEDHRFREQMKDARGKFSALEQKLSETPWHKERTRAAIEKMEAVLTGDSR